MAANTIQIKFRKDAPTHSISITADLDERISETKKKVAEELEKLDPSAKLKPDQSLKFMAFGRILEDGKKWRDYDAKEGVLDLLKKTNSSVIISVQTNIKEETKKSAPAVKKPAFPSPVHKDISESSAALSSSDANPSDFVDQTKADTTSIPKDPFGVQLSQSDSLYAFHSKKEEKKPLPDNEKENEEGLSEDPSIVSAFTPKRKNSCNVM